MAFTLEHLNDQRENHFRAYHRFGDGLSDETVQNWAKHKIYTLITLPANFLKMGASLLGAAAGICTVGAVKIAIYAVTLGNIRMKISTGANWLIHEGVTAFSQIALTVYELGTDIFTLLEKAAAAVKRAITFLGLNHVYEKIKKLAQQAFNWIAKRIAEGFEKLDKREINFLLSNRTTPIFTLLNDQREKWAQYEADDTRSWKNIIHHSLLSFITIPVNVLAFSCSLIASCILFPIALAKIFFYSLTKIEILLPTFVYLSCESAWRSGCHLFDNGARCLQDIPISLYKISEATGIYRVLVTIRDIVTYIPVALFEENHQSVTNADLNP